MGRRSRGRGDDDEGGDADFDDAMERNYLKKRQKVDSDGEGEEASATAEDVDEEKKARKAAKKLRQKEKKEQEKLKTILENAEAGARNLDPKRAKKKKKKNPEGEEGVQEKKEKKEPTLLPLPSGITYYDKQVGKGPEVEDRKTVTVAYTGRAHDPKGKVFDRSSEFKFRLGRGDVIKGWDIGVKGMREGGTRCLYIPPNAGYKDQDVGAGRGGVLYFEIRVVSIEVAQGRH